MTTEGRGIVIPLSETISVAEAERAARQVKEEVAKQQEYVKELQGYRDETKALSKIVKGLPDSVSYNIMVPFGKSAFFPGRLRHTNEFLVLLGEGYYSERSAKQTVDILERRNEFVQSKIANVEAHISDLEAEVSFASNTAAEAKAGVVEIREQVLETDKPFDLSSKSNITKTDSSDQARIKLQGEGGYPASLGHSSMDEDAEHNRIMARIEALEAAEEAAGPMSDDEEVTDEEEEEEETISDHVDDAEAITKSKSYLSKDQKATLLEKLKRSEADEYDREDSDEEDSDSGKEEEYESEEDEEEDWNNRRLSSSSGANPERSGQIKSVGEVQVEGSKKPSRPLSRFGREVQEVKERAGIALEQRRIASQNRDILGKTTASMDEKGASCSGLEILDMQGHNQSQKDWRTQDSTTRGFVLGHKAEKKTTVNPNNDHEKSQKMVEPTPARMQAFTGTVTEHISRPTFPTIAERSSEPSSQIDVGKATDRIAKPSSDSDRQGEEQPARPVSKFRQMRQAGGGR